MDKWIESFPRKGWRLVDIIDYGEPAHECEWCGTIIRYAHVLQHNDIFETTAAGCYCAEKLTDDYITPKRKEKEFKKRQRWVNSAKWKITPSGNCYRKDHEVLIFKIDEDFKLKICDVWGKKKYSTISEAKESAFDYLISIGTINV